jgi:hypothetical protein
MPNVVLIVVTIICYSALFVAACVITYRESFITKLFVATISPIILLLIGLYVVVVKTAIAVGEGFILARRIFK